MGYFMRDFQSGKTGGAIVLHTVHTLSDNETILVDPSYLKKQKFLRTESWIPGIDQRFRR